MSPEKKLEAIRENRMLAPCWLQAQIQKYIQTKVVCDLSDSERISMSTVQVFEELFSQLTGVEFSVRFNQLSDEEWKRLVDVSGEELFRYFFGDVDIVQFINSRKWPASIQGSVRARVTEVTEHVPKRSDPPQPPLLG